MLLKLLQGGYNENTQPILRNWRNLLYHKKQYKSRFLEQQNLNDWQKITPLKNNNKNVY